jgi:hypothetical protein
MRRHPRALTGTTAGGAEHPDLQVGRRPHLAALVCARRRCAHRGRRNSITDCPDQDRRGEMFGAGAISVLASARASAYGSPRGAKSALPNPAGDGTMLALADRRRKVHGSHVLPSCGVELAARLARWTAGPLGRWGMTAPAHLAVDSRAGAAANALTDLQATSGNSPRNPARSTRPPAR